jgi:HAD superfamily hydrolase (TIGR01509 family)
VTVERRHPDSDFELVILDCDGVLVDSERIVARLMAELLSTMDIAMSAEEILRRYIGHSGPEGRRLLEIDVGRPLPEAFFQSLREQTALAFSRDLRPVQDVVTALDALTIPFCVASNGGRQKMETSLSVTGLLSRFHGRMFSATEVANAKPAPDLLLHAARSLGAQPSRCAVVDDTAVGAQAGVAAGMTVFGFAAIPEHAPALVAAGATVFHHMTDLPNLLQGRKPRRGSGPR